MNSRYFYGTPAALGSVQALAQQSFADLCREVVSDPVTLTLTRAGLHALPEKEQQKAKRSDYLVPAVFTASPSPRKTEHATKCNLLFLDVDDAGQAKALLEQGWDALTDFGHVVWHTARSTPKATRLRICVSAEGVPVTRYAAAVRTIATLLGLPDVTHESLVPVQPMYLPVTFQDEDQSPIITSNPDGDPFLPTDIEDKSRSDSSPSDPDNLPSGDLDHLRAPMEGITLKDAESALLSLDPDCSMQQWIEVAAGLKHQFGDDALPLWDQWSSKGEKYVDQEETDYRWSTLKANTPDRAPVTIRTLFKFATDRGWSNKALTQRLFTEANAWLNSSARSTEELLDQGAKRIAKIATVIGSMERRALIQTFKSVMNGRNVPVSLSDIRKDIKEAETIATKTGGVPAWAHGLCYVTALNKFYRHASDRRFAPEVLDLMYTSPEDSEGDSMRPRDFLMKVVQVPCVENLRYDPAMGEKRFFKTETVPYVNTYRASYPKPEPEKAAEAGQIFTEHLTNLIAEHEYRTVLLDFLSYLVQHPGRKIRWAILLQGAQGCGKTFLAVCASAVLGRRNVKKISAGNVLEGTFNSWAYGSQLTVLEEVRIVGHNRYGVMDQLKPCISDDEISVRNLHEPVQTVPNITNYLMFTNHHDSLAIKDDDRRYFVLASPLQRADQIASLGGSDYFDRLFGMVNTNAAGLRSWFEQRTISKDFRPDGRAPRTRYLADLAANAATPLQSAVQEALAEEGHALVRRDLVSLGALRSVLDDDHLPHFSNQALASVLRDLGWEKRERVEIEGLKHLLWTQGVVLDPVGKARGRSEVI